MNSRHIETAISRENVKAAILTQLTGFGVIRNNEHVDLDIDLPEVMPIVLRVTKDKEVQKKTRNGKGST